MSEASSSHPDDVEVLAVIPARGGSKGIPDKNIRTLAGKPLIAYSIEVARSSTYVDRTIISTDSSRIADIAQAHGAEVPFMRPPEYARDRTPDYPVFDHCLSWLESNEGYRPEIVVHLRPTGPLRTAEEVDDSLERFQCYTEADSLRSVTIASKSPYKMWEINEEYLTAFVEHPMIDESYNTPRQALPRIYETTPDIGLCRRATIMKKNSILGDKILPYLIDRPTVDIDTALDFRLAEVIIEEGRY
jgi:N-acylneuraminate cytidylyltransferase